MSRLTATRIVLPFTVTFGSVVFSGDWLAEVMRSRTCWTPASVSPVRGQLWPFWTARPAWHCST